MASLVSTHPSEHGTDPLALRFFGDGEVSSDREESFFRCGTIEGIWNWYLPAAGKWQYPVICIGNLKMEEAGEIHFLGFAHLLFNYCVAHGCDVLAAHVNNYQLHDILTARYGFRKVPGEPFLLGPCYSASTAVVH